MVLSAFCISYYLIGDYMKLNDLFEKEIISVDTGERLGDVYDVEIDESSGLIENVVIKSKFNLLEIFSSRKYHTIEWSKVKVIGDDIVLVESEDHSNQTLFT